MRPCNNLINTPPTLGSKGSEKTTEGRHPLGFLLSGPGAILSGRQSPPGGPDSASRFPRRYTLPFIALLAALTLGLLFLLPGGLLQAQDNGPIMYAENGMGPVATYTAVDPEGADITSWTLGGADADDFMIDGGVLSFAKSPDYEIATDDGTDNTYSVTVQAIDESNKVGMHEVTVEVTNVDEPGTVTLSALQPQAGTQLTATNSDLDGTVSDLKWQWAKSMTMDGTYEDIDKAILGAYTPKDADIDYYLQVTASYTDPEGEGKTAMGTSAYAVQGVRSNNKPPVFPDQDPDEMGDQSDTATREVAENTPAGSAIGDPVVAEDEDGDILTYTLSGDDDDDSSFSIDWATGQLMTKGALDHETGGGTLTVIVRATDPAGVPQGTADEDNDNSDEITVNITVTDVNEPPAVTGDDTVDFTEVAGNINDALDTYMANDPENEVSADPWSLAGADAARFDVSDDGALTFKVKPDYENPTDANTDNVYEVTVRAADADGNIGTMAVKVTVTNEDEEGTVTLSKTQPRVGIVVTASLTDPDGSISGLTWQWYNGAISENNLENNAIEGANSDTYIPKEIDADPNSDADDTDGVTLSARASYTDGHEAEADKFWVGVAANAVAFDTRNKPPEFADQDTETDGVQNTATERKVDENTEAVAADDAVADGSEDTADNVGGVVMAEDPDPNADPLTYTLEGTDASKFRVRDNGQIEVGAGTMLDYETKTSYMVTVMAEDSFGDSASIMVTITVTDINEGPDITGEDTIEYPENRTSSVETYRASDPERAGTITWSLAGTDAALFDISSNGVLTFKEKPNYEMAVEDGTDNMYEVIVRATDADRIMGTKMVEVMVTNVDEPGVVTLSARQPMAGVLLTATITDPDGDPSNFEWQWQKGSSNISGANMETYTPLDSDRGSYLRATVTYKDPESRRDTKRANVRSAYVVLRTASNNNAPAFAADQDPVMVGDQEDAEREIAENTEAGENIGAPVAAMDADSDQRLTYTLGATPDDDSFDIDWATGQLKTKAALNEETKASYEVTVMAEDSFGASATVTVNITVTDVNEPPAVTGDDTVDFTEVAGNINDALDTYMANDPENEVSADPWSLAGADAARFDIITNGALTFKVKPDYEMPTDANMDNVYEVTVRAADDYGNIGTMDVKVTVTNENEAGTVTLSKTRPRVGIAVTASLTDPDGNISKLTWQWANDDDDIQDANSDTYTPVAEDVGDTLMARASYTDGEGDGQSASGASTSQIALDTRNKPPEFADQDTETDGVQNTATERKVDENTEAVAADDAVADGSEDTADNVGGVVAATDPDPNVETPTYTLGGADAAKFRVRANGQIEVGSGTELDYETKGTYTITVMAEDSFGASDTIMVTIMVTDMDEAPEVMRVPDANVAPEFASATTSRMVAENTPAGENIGSSVAANDPNGDALTYTLGGANAASFTIDSATGQLKTLAALDYETKGSYSVTVTATDPDDETATIEVTITVTNVDEMGTLVLSSTTPSVDAELTATLTDLDGMVSGETWMWYKSMDMTFMDGNETVIANATSMSYTPVADDAGYYLMVKVMYTDGHGSGKSASGMTAMTASQVTFAISGTSDPSYMENGTDAVGTYTVTGGTMDATATWTVSGDDAGALTITGGVLTFNDAPDFEAPADADGDNTYMVTVMASAGGEMDTQDVMVRVTNVDEMGTLVLSSTTPSVDAELTATLTDLDGMVSGETWMWYKSMDMTFMDGNETVIANATSMSYTPVADDAGYYLMVKVMYTDGHGSGKSASGMTAMTASQVTFAISGTSDPSYMENGTDAVGTYTVTGGTMDATATWTVSGDDAGALTITGGVLTFNDAPDFEAPADADGDNTYMVTVMASAGGEMDTQDVMVRVTNVDEMGTLVLSSTTPSVDAELTATLTDLDGMVSGETWMWSKSMDMTFMDGNETVIANATSMSYTPVAGDATYYLKVTVTYTDGEGSGKMKEEMTAAAVTAGDPLLAEYDPDGDGMIERADMRRAVANFFGPSPTLSRADMRRLVGIYFN